MLHALLLAAADSEEPSKAPFFIFGGLFAAWAMVLFALGMSRAEFPGGRPGQRGVIAISLVLMAGSMATAVITA